MAIKLREIRFGCPIDDPDSLCIYAAGHLDPAEFLAAVRAFEQSESPAESRESLQRTDVQFIRFRPLSPSEARGHGLDSGVLKVESGGYAVTAVIF